MSYYQTIRELVLDDNDDAIRDWMMAQPLTEQLAIIQTLKEVYADIVEEADMDDKEMLKQQLDNFLESYTDKTLDEHNARVKYDKAVKERDKAFAEMDERISGVRAYLIECVTTNAPNAKEMKELALKIIESEKEHGLYDPQNWQGII